MSDWSILSLDISGASTGWCILTKDTTTTGVIKTLPKFNRSERLNIFRNELKNVLTNYKITAIIVEDNFSKINVGTLKMLAEFAGVAKEVCQDVLKIDPYVISNNTVKAYFKVKTKEELFEFVNESLNLNLTFKQNNDIVDAYSMAMCYADLILGVKKYRNEETYGFSYFGG
jgi:Holliday junction resolvasome RuvABC endonuclease subunit